MTARVLVCGGRDYSDRARVRQVLDALAPKVAVLIHGAARGADTLAGQWARARGVAVEAFPADWMLYGRRAGRIRNKRMLLEGKPDLVVAFPGGLGTEHMVMIARDAGVQVMRVAACRSNESVKRL